MKFVRRIKKEWQGLNWNKIRSKIEQADWRKIGVGALIVALTLIAVSTWNLFRQGYLGQRIYESESAAVEVWQDRHPLTGVLVGEPVDCPEVLAVMVENSADAWPQSGIDQAFLVIEAPTEGGIPRLLAFFGADQDVDEIGPVRSARPYFIDWAAGFRPLYAHVGGSPAAIARLGAGDEVLDLDEFYNQYLFWRSPERWMPHNVYTSLSFLRLGLAKRYSERTTVDCQTYLFKDDRSLDTRPTEVMDVVAEFGADLYRATWVYDRQTNSYQRFENTSAHVTANGAPIYANNVVIIQTEMTVLDTIGRLDIETIGEGQGLLAQDGVETRIVWKKESTTDLLRFYDLDGFEIKLNAGTTWIEIVK